jgi:diadenosine tetraphosphate (Ap4A) HIT family hydrolase
VLGRLYNLEAARGPEQRANMEAMERDRRCVFCADEIEQSGRAIERLGEFWYVTRNEYPYPGTLQHYLIVPRQHVTRFEELPDAAGAELWAFRRWLSERHDPFATATVERSGALEASGGSVAHLHVHFAVLPPDPIATVRFRVSARGSASRTQ